MKIEAAELAKMIDHSILHPSMTTADLIRECEIARKYNVASVCVKPYMVKQAVDLLKDSGVLTGCVIGFPAGNSTIAVKVFETEQACNDGAVEIDMVINIGKALEGDWSYIKEEIGSVTRACHESGAIVKVIFETDYVTRPEDIIRLCEICTDVGADYVKTSTGFGFVKGEDGKFSYVGATIANLELMRRHSGPNVKIKAAGGVRTLDQLLAVRAAGCTRCGATATATIIDSRDARQCVSTRRNKIARLITVGLLAAAAIAIASLTVGRDIYHGSAGEGMTSFAIVNFAGYLFFLFMPVELAFIYYVSEGVNLWTLNGIAIGTALLSQTVDYLIGYSFSTKIINRLIGRKRYLMAESRIRKFGNIAILVFNALPLSSPVISLSAGILKFRVGEAFFYTATGLLIKYTVLTLIFS